jgi:hypothetical protein
MERLTCPDSGNVPERSHKRTSSDRNVSFADVISIDPQLEEVAGGDIPAPFTHVIGVSLAPSGRYAVVMLSTNEGAGIEFDQTVAELVGDPWVDLGSGTPSSLVYAGDHRASVICNYSDPLPPEVERVVVRDRAGRTRCRWRTATSSTPPGNRTRRTTTRLILRSRK